MAPVLYRSLNSNFPVLFNPVFVFLVSNPLQKLCEVKDDSSLINLHFSQCLPQCLVH